VARFRKLVRQDGWIKVEITLVDKAKHNINHGGLFDWAHGLAGQEGFAAILRRASWTSSDNAAVSVFAFKEPAHATMFIMRWK
jgi:hypothetical protein